MMAPNVVQKNINDSYESITVIKVAKGPVLTEVLKVVVDTL